MDNNEDLDNRFTTHEAVCAERWKTVFNQLEGIETRAGKRFDGVENSVSRLETILISAAGAGILGGVAVIWTFITMS
jgi:hypothetical protein|tara:strand:+ start:587 stop:817 length:231 start_codon:yes stop_codon:yes gene_type:complete